MPPAHTVRVPRAPLRLITALLIAVLTPGAAAASDASGPARPACAEVEPIAGLTPAETVFERARQAWSAAAYPRAIAFGISVRVKQRDDVHVSHYAGEYAPRDGALFVGRFSREETARPHVAHGVDAFVSLTLYGHPVYVRKLTPDQPTFDYLGAPRLSPTYAFGLQRELRPATPAASPHANETASPLHVIGQTFARSRDYAIACAEPATGVETGLHHLRLRPLRDPHRFRIREMWVDVSSFATRTIVTEGNFTDGPPLGVRWTITFRTIDGAHYIDTETATAALRYGHGRTYDEASITFDPLEPRAAPSLRLALRQPESPDDLREP